MELIYHPVFLRHDTGMHPENAKRLAVFGELPVTDVPDGTPWLGLVHTADHVENVRVACAMERHLDPDTMTSQGSFEAACYAVGATVHAAGSGGFALVRPPGHHAYADHSSGFCLFNNIAVAAQKLALEGRKVFLFDFDGHFGDGTAAVFRDSSQVFYCSIHQYPAFPGQGWYDELGRGEGRGYTMNIPLPPESGDDVFRDAVRTCLSVLDQYQPDVIAVSAGFDAHRYDLLLQLRVTESSFHFIGEQLRRRQCPVFATLEGGYNVQVLPACVHNFHAGIHGEPMPFPAPVTTSARRVWEEYEIRLHGMTGLLRPWWRF